MHQVMLSEFFSSECTVEKGEWIHTQDFPDIPPAKQETSVRFLGQEDPLEKGYLSIPVFWDFPGGSEGEESACNAEDLGSIPGLGRSPGGEHGNPFQYSCLENPHGQRSLVGYSLWGCKELGTTE